MNSFLSFCMVKYACNMIEKHNNGYKSCVPSYGRCKNPAIKIQKAHSYFLLYFLKEKR